MLFVGQIVVSSQKRVTSAGRSRQNSSRSRPECWAVECRSGRSDYPSPAHRRSYARRTGSERTFATLKDPATTTIARGWCRLTGLAPLALWLACLLAVRNQRILSAWDIRQGDNNKRAAAGLPPRNRKRRRKTLASLSAAPP
jgi:hypothetical protein